MKIKFETWSMLEMNIIESKNDKLIFFGTKRNNVSYEKKISIEQNLENSFYNKFNELGVWNWVRDFDKLAEYEPLPDGFSWSLNANIKDKKIKSSGNNTYPKSYNELIKFFDKISGINNFKNLRYYKDSQMDMVIDGY